MSEMLLKRALSINVRSGRCEGRGLEVRVPQEGKQGRVWREERRNVGCDVSNIRRTG